MAQLLSVFKSRKNGKYFGLNHRRMLTQIDCLEDFYDFLEAENFSKNDKLMLQLEAANELGISDMESFLSLWTRYTNSRSRKLKLSDLGLAHSKEKK